MKMNDSLETPMRVALVVPEYRTERGRSGGVDAVVQFVLGAIAEHTNWKVEIASLRMSRRAPESRRLLNVRTWLRGPVSRRRSVDGVDVTYFGALLAEVEFTRFLPRRNLDRFLESFDAAVVISGSPAAAYPLNRLRIPVLLQVATFVKWERPRLRQQQGLVRRWLHVPMDYVVGVLDDRGLRRAQMVVVENQEMLRSAAAREDVNVELLPPGVDTTVFKPTATAVPGSYILFVGRLNDPRKDLPSLLRAYAIARESHGVTLPLKLAGLYAPTRGDLLLIDELGLGPYVQIETGLDRDELVSLYQNATLFVMASAEEGLGIVLLEAMACGVPVVSTATAGASFAVGDGGGGVLVDRGDRLPEDLATAMAPFLSDEALRAHTGRVARAWVVDNFSAEVLGEQFISSICKISQRHMG